MWESEGDLSVQAIVEGGQPDKAQAVAPISHDFGDETLDAKARWFQSLSLIERMDLLCEFTDMILDINPQIAENKRNAQPVAGRILILSKT